MSDANYLPDSPPEATAWCPGCAPERDPIKELIYEQRCADHTPKRDGADDDLVSTSGAWLGGSNEGDGDTGRAFAEIVHRNVARTGNSAEGA